VINCDIALRKVKYSKDDIQKWEKSQPQAKLTKQTNKKKKRRNKEGGLDGLCSVVKDVLELCNKLSRDLLYSHIIEIGVVQRGIGVADKAV